MAAAQGRHSALGKFFAILCQPSSLVDFKGRAELCDGTSKSPRALGPLPLSLFATCNDSGRGPLRIECQRAGVRHCVGRIWISDFD